LAFAFRIYCVHSDVSLVGLHNESLWFAVPTAQDLYFSLFPWNFPPASIHPNAGNIFQLLDPLGQL